MLDQQILSKFLPKGILDYFEITGETELPDYTGKELKLLIELTKYNKVPSSVVDKSVKAFIFEPTQYQPNYFRSSFFL